MTPGETNTRARIIELFEKHRATPGVPYEEDHFLDFLLAEPKDRRAVYNSFRGLRRFNAFLDEVQYEFAVCFSLEDREASYPLEKFVGRVLELQKSRRGSLKSLDHQAKAGAGWQLLVVANIVLLIAAVSLRNSPWAMAALIGIAVLLDAWFLRLAWKAKAYLARLRARIEAAQ